MCTINIQRERLWSSECTAEIKMWNQRIFLETVQVLRSEELETFILRVQPSACNVRRHLQRGLPHRDRLEWWLPCLDSTLRSRNQRVCHIPAGSRSFLLIYCCKSKQTKIRHALMHPPPLPQVHVKIFILSLDCTSFYLICNSKCNKAECRAHYFLCV